MPNILKHKLSNFSHDNKKAVCIICGDVNTRQIKSKNGTRLYCDFNRTLSRKTWKQNNKFNHRVYKLKSTYNLTPEDYFELSILQNHMCAICGKNDEDETLNVDHCHNSNKVRGLLCRKCNLGLGLFLDSIEILSKAIDYLS